MSTSRAQLGEWDLHVSDITRLTHQYLLILRSRKPARRHLSRGRAAGSALETQNSLRGGSRARVRQRHHQGSNTSPRALSSCSKKQPCAPTQGKSLIITQKQAFIRSRLSRGELGTAELWLRLNSPRHRAPTPHRHRSGTYGSTFASQGRAEPTVRHGIAPPCPRKPLLSPKSSGALPAHPAKLPGTTCSPSRPTKPRVGFQWLSISPSPLLVLPPQHIFLAARRCLNLLSLHADFP